MVYAHCQESVSNQSIFWNFPCWTCHLVLGKSGHAHCSALPCWPKPSKVTSTFTVSCELPISSTVVPRFAHVILAANSLEVLTRYFKSFHLATNVLSRRLMRINVPWNFGSAQPKKIKQKQYSSLDDLKKLDGWFEGAYIIILRE